LRRARRTCPSNQPPGWLLGDGPGVT
jgi:hypothetical protein